MIVRKAYKFKLKTNRREKTFFSKVAGCTRLVWNKSLAMQKDNCEYINKEFKRLGGKAMSSKEAKKLKKYLYKKHFPTGYDIATKALVQIWKKSEEFSFLNECPAQSLQKPLADLDKALYKCFSKKGGFPKFKKKGYRDSIYFPQCFKIKDNKVFLPKIGYIKFFKTREIEGTVKNINVTSDGLGNWFASFCTEQEIDIKERCVGEVGVDLGITNFATTSKDQFIKKPKKLKQLEIIKRRVSKSLSRRKKGGKNREKVRLLLNKTHQKITNIRNDFLHKFSTTLSKNHATIVLEDLKVSNMSKSAKGNIEEHGKNVKAKSGLNREILANGWSSFRTMLEYKQLYSGGKLVKINPRNTSLTCSSCGTVDKENRTSQSSFRCTSCGYKENADINAAKNILEAGRVSLGDIEKVTSLAQESLCA
jgi:putative transposase